MDELTGAFVTVGMGVIAIAAIYQLNKKGSPLVPGAVSLGTTTLTSIFK
jgi:hypothetical protein